MPELLLPPPIAPTFFVGVLNFELVAGPHSNPWASCPPHRTSTVFSFSDPVQAGACLAAVCRVSDVRRALEAALLAGYVPRSGHLPGESCLAHVCRPGDMWACVAYLPERHSTGGAGAPLVYVGFYGDLNVQHHDLKTTPVETVFRTHDVIFGLGILSCIG
jgi:hypothetical protein